MLREQEFVLQVTSPWTQFLLTPTPNSKSSIKHMTRTIIHCAHGTNKPSARTVNSRTHAEFKEDKNFQHFVMKIYNMAQGRSPTTYESLPIDDVSSPVNASSSAVSVSSCMLNYSPFTA
ncbi:hypothetical protein Baya_1199 [Bagarius yarrelli]|uniref:Uncharacterized protein n=1 Tax=Bagarius yarrelli TaxID=175774 RepID=A0A556TKE7_BAGYA|nr:hypothetical protein Baya_1199 [Bagarius yarrelli]